MAHVITMLTLVVALAATAASHVPAAALMSQDSVRPVIAATADPTEGPGDTFCKLFPFLC
ncbi:hypothetical protein BRM3_05315 [Brachybacterium huguangmaarense]|uniref:Uncharacterized protein n=1 Tax=Brachybacterium huguangmaarense TaxID=1652028 RepID=A0ABY6G3Q6_9MICO|nr:hypothetical protein [Brachybacterium huguangmaarense]UYG17842.1 hypothetical protein BRM3_05315 [Brachybacterium huguangmaarense]